MRSNTLFCYLLLVILPFLTSVAQQAKEIISGPMLGQIELRTAKIWVEVKPGSSVELWYWKKGKATSPKKIRMQTTNDVWFAPLIFNLVGLEMNTTYEYKVLTNNKANIKPSNSDGEFSTLELWQYRNSAPDFSFITGSCSYFNETIYDRPGTPYGKDSSIFEAMTKEKAAFMLWLGDNWYLREPDFFSEWGLWYRASRDRSLPFLQRFLRSMPQYAIWDDHDYGPNNADKTFHLKESSRRVFMNYWANPSYGQEDRGIYTKVSYGDADFFLMDSRYFRSADDMEPTVMGKANQLKRMWGHEQMDWLVNALINSKAVFKIIATGSQILNPVSTTDCLQDYPAEFEALMSFLSEEKINGVLFLTGDRHRSEVIRYTRPNGYALYDVTISPLTSGIARAVGPEKENPGRVPGTLVEAQNYSRISIAGKQNERKLTVEFLGIKGEKLAEWSILEKDLRNK